MVRYSTLVEAGSGGEVKKRVVGRKVYMSMAQDLFVSIASRLVGPYLRAAGPISLDVVGGGSTRGGFSGGGG